MRSDLFRGQRKPLFFVSGEAGLIGASKSLSIWLDRESSRFAGPVTVRYVIEDV
jgi:hypothetical protein